MLKKLSIKKPQIWLPLAIIIYVILLFTASFIKYHFNLYNNIDLAISNQVFWNSANGDYFLSSIQPPSYLAYHLAIFNFFLLPIYKIVGSPLTLLFLQTIFLGLAAWPLYLIAKRYFSSALLYLIVLAWFLNPFVHSINLFEWHITSILPFFIFWLWYFFITNKFIPYSLILLLTLLIREEAAYTAISLGFMLLFMRRLNKRRLVFGLITLILSIGWFFTALKLVSTYQPENKYIFIKYYDWLGNSLPEIINVIINHPIFVLKNIISPDVALMWIILFIPMVFVCLLSPQYLIGLFIPAAVIILGRTYGPAIFMHYTAPLIPIIFIAYIYGILTLLKITAKKIHFFNLAVLILYAAVIYSFFTLSPLGHTLFFPIIKADIANKNLNNKELILKNIDAQSGVIGGKDFLTILSNRKDVSFLNYLFSNKYQFSSKEFEINKNTQFIIFIPEDLMILYGDTLPPHDYGLKMEKTIKADYSLILAEENFVIFKKDGLKNNFIYYQEFEETPKSINKKIVNLGLINFLGWEINRLPDNYGNNIVLHTYWQYPDQNQTKLFNFKIEIKASGQTIYDEILPPSLGLVPTWRWPNDKIIKTAFLLKKSIFSKKSDYQINITPVSITSYRLLNRTASQEYTIKDLKILSSSADFTANQSDFQP